MRGNIHRSPAYWQTHMELMGDRPAFDLYDPSWVIHTCSEERPPADIRSGAQISSSLISHGCINKGRVERSVLSPGVVVEEDAVVQDSIVLFESIIGAGSVIERAILDKDSLTCVPSMATCLNSCLQIRYWTERSHPLKLYNNK